MMLLALTLLELIGCAPETTGLGEVTVTDKDQKRCDAHPNTVFVPGRGVEADGRKVKDKCVDKFEFSNSRYDRFLASLTSSGMPQFTVTTACTRVVSAATAEAAENLGGGDNCTTSSIPVSTDIKNDSPVGLNGADQPNVMQTWTQAKAACEFEGGALLTEGEWFNAASGTSGNDLFATPTATRLLASEATYDTNHTTNVEDANHANSFGIHNMTGNAWERVITSAIIRGGVYYYINENYLRVAFRFDYYAFARNPDVNVGFRCGFAPRTQE